MNATAQAILDALNREKIRATYGAVADVLGIPAGSVGQILGMRRPEASWVVEGRFRYAERLRAPSAPLGTDAAFSDHPKRGTASTLTPRWTRPEMHMCGNAGILQGASEIGSAGQLWANRVENDARNLERFGRALSKSFDSSRLIGCDREAGSTQNPVGFTPRVGSIPTSGTNLSSSYRHRCLGQLTRFSRVCPRVCPPTSSGPRGGPLR